jgi:energy-coupling factor transporter ATP-binding protein EcfA2
VSPVDRMQQTAVQFDNYLGTRGLVYEPQVKGDLLAAVLSSQFVLFAGPSGTGKSTAAMALADFFTPGPRRATVTVERTWETPQDVVGAYSSFAGYYLAKPGLDELLRMELHDAATDGSVESCTPVVVVEEANLSAIEGYLNPVVHGLSAPAKRSIRWDLHPLDHLAPRSGEEGAPQVIPPALELGPWPRFLGTINVDHTAIAPARKVSGRACVVLLEPMEASASADGVDALWEGVGAGDRDVGPEELLHDPRTALASLRGDPGLAALATGLDQVTSQLAEALGANPVSKRDEQRCLLYMAFFQEIAPHVPGFEVEDLLVKTAENAVLHFVLPGLTPQQFAVAVDLFRAPGSASLLRSRCARLMPEDADASLGYAVDFWTALS